MVSYLCDICHGRYSREDLAEKCEEQGIPDPERLQGTWVRYSGGGSENTYGIVANHSVNKNIVVGDSVMNEIATHKLLCEITPSITEILHGGNKSSYWPYSSIKKVLEEECITLSSKEVKVIEAIKSKSGSEGTELPSFDFLVKQKDFAKYLN